VNLSAAVAKQEPYVNQLTIPELVELSAADSIFFCQQFFPKTFRQLSPKFHRKVWEILDDPDEQFVGLELFRGSGKTTLCRANVAKRISYGISRTIIFVSASQGHAVRSVRWLKKQVETNKFWTQTFGLRKGKKWSDEEIEIINTVEGFSIYILALGITGQTRGVNLEDYRPDFIIVDDPCDEENTGTAEQLAKGDALLYGALAPGLAPRSESPWSKMALLQTGLNKKDPINKAHDDPEWRTVKFSILDDNDESAWPERWTTKEIHTKKAHYIRRGQAHLWAREYECKIIAPEEAPLKLEWLQYWDYLPESMVVYFGIDPAREKSTNPHKTCIVCVGINGPDVYLLDYFEQSSLDPEEVWAAFLGLAKLHKPFMTSIETIAYQQTLKWYFEKRAKETRNFYTFIPIEDRRKKPDRILQELGHKAADGHFYVNAERHGKWIDYFRDWRWGMDIDLLDATAINLLGAAPQLLYGSGEDAWETIMNEDHIPDLKTSYLVCP